MRELSHKRPTNLKKFLYGSAYYPEHWDESVRKTDPAWMKDAGWNVVRMGEFAWDLIEPRAKGGLKLDLFDRTIAELGKNGISTIFCTPTKCPPRWMSHAYPEILRVNHDGVPMQHGSRSHACQNSSLFREHSRRITALLAKHFKDNPHVIGWQTDNEFNCEFVECHCLSCRLEFQEWLRRKYHDDIAELNKAWGTAFWAQSYGSFDEVLTCRCSKPTDPNPTHYLEYLMFIAWSIQRFQHDQVEILREANPKWFVTHNGTMDVVDYRGGFGRDLDFLGYDCYPLFDRDPTLRPASNAWKVDTARAWSGNVVVMEQQSGPGGAANFLLDTAVPGEVRRMAYVSLSRGADGVLFFRWRTCRFGAEEYWCGVLDQDNVRRRRYHEIAQMGEEMGRVGPAVLGTHVHVDTGIAWADLAALWGYEVMKHGLPKQRPLTSGIHRSFWKRNHAVGMVHPADDLSDLKLFIVPHWNLFDPAWVPNLEKFVRRGGTLVIGARTATKNMLNCVVAETPPGVLAKLAGCTVEEFGRQNSPDKRPYRIRIGAKNVLSDLWYEILEPRGARIMARWTGGHLDGQPAVTVNRVGKGNVVYVGTYLNEPVTEFLIDRLTKLSGIKPLLAGMPSSVSVSLRTDGKRKLWFLLNNADRKVRVQVAPEGLDLVSNRRVTDLLSMDPQGVAVIQE